VPKRLDGPAPAILYLCGHSPAKKDGVSYGNKTMYQHHGAWFARNGYLCLVLDTLQLGEIEGIHHGTYREKMWWWNSVGYTPAGVEAWNAIRAVDYLESRSDVDADRMGVTGRSGGGASSWWVAALDDRIKAVVPVAGITSLENHVVDGCVEGHCDCMYFVNAYQWDFAQVAALVAPRPLLLANTDHDEIFPLDGVMDVYWKVRQLYDLAGKAGNLGLQIAAGPHEDLQVLQLHALQWFNRHLKGDEAPIETRARNFFEPEQLKVFDELPADSINTRVHDSFTVGAPAPEIPSTGADWAIQRSGWLSGLREKSFRAWPHDAKPSEPPALRKLSESTSGDIALFAYEFDSQEHVTLPLYVLAPAGKSVQDLETIVLHPLDAEGWSGFLLAMRERFPDHFSNGPAAAPETVLQTPFDLALASIAKDRALAFVAPRGIGPTAWAAGNPQAHTHIRRRFMLLGQTLDAMRVWDVRRAIQAVRTLDGLADATLGIDADREMADIALYAALFEPRVARLDLRGLSSSHRDGSDFLNVLRILDVPQAVAIAAEGAEVRIESGNGEWEYPLAVAETLGWKGRIEISSGPARTE
jgi:hypothetical protein